MSGGGIALLLVDDHPLFREGLRVVLASQADLRVVGEAGTGREALALFERSRPDVILLDLDLPDVDGTKLVPQVLRLDPSARVVVLTAFGGDVGVRASFAAGARGYVLKGSPPADLIDAIRRVHRGQLVVPPELAPRLAGALAFEPLTRREQEILERIARGGSNAEVAHDLGVGVTTIKSHVHNLLAKLGARDRTQALIRAAGRGLVRLR